MNIQTIEIAGQRFVILPEPEFQELERRVLCAGQTSPLEPPSGKPKFEPVTPFEIQGESASDMLIRERR